MLGNTATVSAPAPQRHDTSYETERNVAYNPVHTADAEATQLSSRVASASAVY